MRDRIAIVDINTKKFKALSYKQYDENNTLQIVIINDGKLINVSNYTVKVYFQLPSGKIYELLGVIYNNTINVVLTKSILSESGKVIVEVELSSNSEIITTFSMYLNVEKSINKDPEFIPEDEINKYHEHNNLDILNQITQDMIDTIINIEDITWEDINIDLSNYYTKDEVDKKFENIDIEDIDLSNYYTKDEVNEKIEDIDIENIDMSNYYTKEEINNKFEDINIENIDLSNYYTKEEINNKFEDINIENIDMSNYYTKEEVNEKIEDIDMSSYAKKEELDVKANNLFQTDMVTQSTLGGISAGTDLNNMSLQDVLTKLLYPYIAPTISASITYSPTGNVYEYGQTVKVTNIKTTVTKKSENITSIKFYQNNSLVNELTKDISLGGSFTYTFSSPISITSSISNSYFQAKATDNSGKTVTANTVALNFYYPYYYGVINEGDEITEELIKGLTKQVVAKGNKSYTYSPNYQCMVIAYPKSYGVLKSILDPNGFEQINSFTLTELQIVGLDGTSQTYYAYSNGASTNTNFTMKFNY